MLKISFLSLMSIFLCTNTYAREISQDEVHALWERFRLQPHMQRSSLDALFYFDYKRKNKTKEYLFSSLNKYYTFVNFGKSGYFLAQNYIVNHSLDKFLWYKTHGLSQFTVVPQNINSFSSRFELRALTLTAQQMLSPERPMCEWVRTFKKNSALQFSIGENQTCYYERQDLQEYSDYMSYASFVCVDKSLKRLVSFMNNDTSFVIQSPWVRSELFILDGRTNRLKSKQFSGTRFEYTSFVESSGKSFSPFTSSEGLSHGIHNDDLALYACSQNKTLVAMPLSLALGKKMIHQNQILWTYKEKQEIKQWKDLSDDLMAELPPESCLNRGMVDFRCGISTLNYVMRINDFMLKGMISDMEEILQTSLQISYILWFIHDELKDWGLELQTLKLIQLNAYILKRYAHLASFDLQQEVLQMYAKAPSSLQGNSLPDFMEILDIPETLKAYL